MCILCNCIRNKRLAAHSFPINMHMTEEESNTTK